MERRRQTALSKKKFLSKEQQKDLILRYRELKSAGLSDGEEAKEIVQTLLNNVMGFIVKTAQRYYRSFTPPSKQGEGKVVQVEDLINEGVIAFLKSLDKYDPNHDSKSSFLTFIRGPIQYSMIWTFQRAYEVPTYVFWHESPRAKTRAFNEWTAFIKSGGAVPLSQLEDKLREQGLEQSEQPVGQPVNIKSSEEDYENIDSDLDRAAFHKLMSSFFRAFRYDRNLPKDIVGSITKIKKAMKKRKDLKKELAVFKSFLGYECEKMTLQKLSKEYKISINEVKSIISFYQPLLKNLLKEAGY